jgi:hypothetical protein
VPAWDFACSRCEWASPTNRGVESAMNTRKKKRKSRSQLHQLLTIAPWVPTDGRPVAISAGCPNPKCGVRYVWRSAARLAKRIATWPPPDAVRLTTRRGRFLLAEPQFEGYAPYPELQALTGRVPTKLHCYACGSAMTGYRLDQYKESARLGARRTVTAKKSHSRRHSLTKRKRSR